MIGTLLIEPEWVALFCFSTLLAFTVASTLGIGGPLILLPILMLKFSPAVAVAMIVPAMFANNIGCISIFFKHIQLRPALIMLAGALPFAAGTAFLTGRVDTGLIKLLVVAVIAYVLMSRYIFSVRPKVKRLGLFLWGIPTGMISGLSGTAGPTMAIAMRGHGLVLQQFVATTAVVQACLQVVRVPGYISSGLLHASHWELAFIMAIFSFPAIFISRIILRRLKPEPFRIALDVLLGVIGLVMLANLIKTTF